MDRPNRPGGVAAQNPFDQGRVNRALSIGRAGFRPTIVHNVHIAESKDEEEDEKESEGFGA